MEIEQARYRADQGWSPTKFGHLGSEANLVLLLGQRQVLNDSKIVHAVKETYPNAHIVGCSTAGEIYSTNVYDESLVLTAIKFEHTSIESSVLDVGTIDSSYEAGKQLATSIPHENLAHAFVLSEGINVNGSELVKGLSEHLPHKVTVTGGLSGDGEQFGETSVVYMDNVKKNLITIVGFYGDRLKVGYGSLGGWDTFGPKRIITKSKDNILYEVDGHSALELYKHYLGDQANELPAAGLLFPLQIENDESDHGVVRTILGINEEDQSMIFAGDMPEGSYAQLMKANFERLIEGAMDAAKNTHEITSSNPPELAILISCVGRKMVLKQRIEEEVEGVREILGNDTALAGFYSYGEISPFTPNAKCELHNQTMTITTFSEG